MPEEDELKNYLDEIWGIASGRYYPGLTDVERLEKIQELTRYVLLKYGDA